MITRSNPWFDFIYKFGKAYLVSLFNFQTVTFIQNFSSLDWRILVNSYLTIWIIIWLIETRFWLEFLALEYGPFLSLLMGVMGDITFFLYSFYGTVIMHLVSSYNFGKIWKRCNASMIILVFIKMAWISGDGWSIGPKIDIDALVFFFSIRLTRVFFS